MPQTKDQKRRNAIDLKQASIRHWRRQIENLRELMSRPLENAEVELLRAYDYDVNEKRKSLVAQMESKIRIHERDIANTEARLGL